MSTNIKANVIQKMCISAVNFNRNADGGIRWGKRIGKKYLLVSSL